jgi:hypothetical protein
MLFLADENVPDEVVEFFRARGHDVRKAREELYKGASDRHVVESTNELAATVLTWNVKDFDRLVARRPPDGNQQRWRHVSAIYFSCKEPRAVRRLVQLINLVEFEYKYAETRRDHRVFINIEDNQIRILR